MELYATSTKYRCQDCLEDLQVLSNGNRVGTLDRCRERNISLGLTMAMAMAQANFSYRGDPFQGQSNHCQPL